MDVAASTGAMDSNPVADFGSETQQVNAEMKACCSL